MLINQQINHTEVVNPIAGLPSFSTTDLVVLMRIDKTMGSDRIAGYIRTAYRTVNRQIPICQALKAPKIIAFNTVGTCVWEHAPTLYSHHHRLSSDKTKTSLTQTELLAIVSDDDWQETYKDAVLYEAAALMADNYMDFDTIGQGITRGNNQETKSDALRRVSTHAIADLTGQSRNRVRLL